MRRVLTTLAALALVAPATACLDDVTGTRPLSLSVTVDDATPTVGQTVTFSFDATGTALSEVTLEFGDGASDTHTYFGPVEASGFSTHAYTATGTYTVRGEVVAGAGTTTDSVTVTVN